MAVHENNNEVKTALITGITGQAGSYLAEFLLKKGYQVVFLSNTNLFELMNNHAQVHGIYRRTSTLNTFRLRHLIDTGKNLHLHYGDMTDTSSLIATVIQVCRDD